MHWCRATQCNLCFGCRSSHRASKGQGGAHHVVRGQKVTLSVVATLTGTDSLPGSHFRSLRSQLLLLLLLLCYCVRSCQSYKANNPEVHVSVSMQSLFVCRGLGVFADNL